MLSLLCLVVILMLLVLNALCSFAAAMAVLSYILVLRIHKISDATDDVRHADAFVTRPLAKNTRARV